MIITFMSHLVYILVSHGLSEFLKKQNISLTWLKCAVMQVAMIVTGVVLQKLYQSWVNPNPK